MKFKDLRDFIEYLEQKGQLKRIKQPVDPDQEITEICDRTLRAGGPALLFENPVGYDMPILANLYGTLNGWRWEWAARMSKSCVKSASYWPT